ncbi:MAG: SMC-Scp complex subunit ScpB [Eubacteriaceae bacterium]|jgi:chromosome segregation and condensation protein ScpB|nr:SMC-Scp complex subunit ScpB [Eubacteriaceae bacterium]
MGKDIYLAAIEAILFAAGEPIPIRTISIALNID